MFWNQYGNNVAIKEYGAHIHMLLRMDLNDFGDLNTIKSMFIFHLVNINANEP